MKTKVFPYRTTREGLSTDCIDRESRERLYESIQVTQRQILSSAHISQLVDTYLYCLYYHDEQTKRTTKSTRVVVVVVVVDHSTVVVLIVSSSLYFCGGGYY